MSEFERVPTYGIIQLAFATWDEVYGRGRAGQSHRREDGGEVDPDCQEGPRPEAKGAEARHRIRGGVPDAARREGRSPRIPGGQSREDGRGEAGRRAGRSSEGEALTPRSTYSPSSAPGDSSRSFVLPEVRGASGKPICYALDEARKGCLSCGDTGKSSNVLSSVSIQCLTRVMRLHWSESAGRSSEPIPEWRTPRVHHF